MVRTLTRRRHSGVFARIVQSGSLLGILAAGLVGVEPAAASPAVVAQAGGAIGDLVISGDIAYVAQGPAISVWQLDPTGIDAPQRVGGTAPHPGLVVGLAVGGDWLFASWRSTEPSGRLAIYSLADPLAPAHLLDFEYSASSFLSPGGVVVLGDHLVLADSEVGLVTIDVSNPASPSVVGGYETFGLQRLASTSSGLVGWGRSFFGSLFLETFDVTDPTEPESIGFYGAGNYLDAAMTGDLAVLIGDGFELVDLTDLSDPTWLATVPEVVGRTALALGRYAYVGDRDEVQVWDLDDPAQPVSVGTLAAPADRTARTAVHQGASGPVGILVTETGRLLAIDLTVAATPSLEHAVDLPVGIDTTAVREQNGRLHLADFYSGLRLGEPDFSSLGRLDFGIEMGAYEDLTIQDDIVWVASWGHGLLGVDISNEVAPTLLGEAEIAFASAVDVAGDRAYVATSTNGGFLVVVDIADPADPTVLGSLELSKGMDVLYHGGHVLVADEEAFDLGGLRIIDVSNPASPSLLARYGDCASAGGVDAVGTVAAVACHDGSVHLVDITVPTAPVQLGVWSDPGRFLTGYRVLFDGPRLWFGHTEGVELLQVSNPAAPRRVAGVDLAWPVRGLDLAADGSAWAATGSAGLYRVDLVVFADGFESGDPSGWSGVEP